MPALAHITETHESLRERIAATRKTLVRDRLHLLLLIQSGAAQTLADASERLLRHRNTLARWLALYKEGGIEALVNVGRPGQPRGQRSMPPDVFEALRARLSSPTGFASFVEVEHWLAEAHGVRLSYSTVHQIVRYGLGAKLKAPRPVHPKKAT